MRALSEPAPRGGGGEGVWRLFQRRGDRRRQILQGKRGTRGGPDLRLPQSWRPGWFSVEQGPGPPSRLSPSGFPSPDPSLLLVPGTAADTRRGPHPGTRGGVGLGSQVAPQAAHPSRTPRPACARSPHSLSEGRGRPAAVRALQRQELGTGRGGQLQGRRLMPEEDDPRQVREPLPQHGSGPPAPQSSIS